MRETTGDRSAKASPPAEGAAFYRLLEVVRLAAAPAGEREDLLRVPAEEADQFTSPGMEGREKTP